MKFRGGVRRCSKSTRRNATMHEGQRQSCDSARESKPRHSLSTSTKPWRGTRMRRCTVYDVAVAYEAASVYGVRIYDDTQKSDNHDDRSISKGAKPRSGSAPSHPLELSPSIFHFFAACDALACGGHVSWRYRLSSCRDPARLKAARPKPGRGCAFGGSGGAGGCLPWVASPVEYVVDATKSSVVVFRPTPDGLETSTNAISDYTKNMIYHHASTIHHYASISPY